MSQRVPSEVAVPAKHLAAVGTVVRFDVCVGEKVGLEVGTLVKRPSTRGTLVGRVLHVQDLVHRKGPRLAEALATLQALERLLLRVNVPMIPEVVLAPERLSADVTSVGPLVSMGPLVDQQVVGLGEPSLAESAYELLLGPRCPRTPEQLSVQMFFEESRMGEQWTYE